MFGARCLNTDATWNPASNFEELGWVLCDSLGHVHREVLFHKCQEMKLLKAMAICFCLQNLCSISISNILVEFDCLEVINLLNDVAIDLSKVSFFIEEAKVRSSEMGVVSFSHIYFSHNVLAHCVVHKTLEYRSFQSSLRLILILSGFLWLYLLIFPCSCLILLH